MTPTLAKLLTDDLSDHLLDDHATAVAVVTELALIVASSASAAKASYASLNSPYTVDYDSVDTAAPAAHAGILGAAGYVSTIAKCKHPSCPVIDALFTKCVC